MSQLPVRADISSAYPIPSNGVARAAMGVIWDVINEMSQAAEIDLASAATTNIGVQVSRKLRITGTTGITSFGTTYTGPIVLRFSGALTITHHATTLICPGGANLTVASGDIIIATPKCTTSGTFDGWMIVARPDSQHAALAGSASQTFAASGLTVTGGSPAITYNETDAGADLKKWLVHVDGSIYRVLTLTDAGAGILQALNLDRSGTLTVGGNFSGNLVGSIGSGVTGTTQAVGTVNTTIATTQFCNTGFVKNDVGPDTVGLPTVLYNNIGGSIASNATTAGSNLQGVVSLGSTGVWTAGAAMNGTWRNVSGATTNNGFVVTFQRIS